MGPAPEDIVAAIIKDLTDRRGFRQEWDQCDAETREEIRSTWADIVRGMMFPAESE